MKAKKILWLVVALIVALSVSVAMVAPAAAWPPPPPEHYTVDFATSGLPGFHVAHPTISGAYTNPGGSADTYSFQIWLPTFSSGNVQVKKNTAFTYSGFPTSIVVGSNTYSLVSTLPASGFTVSGDTTVVATYCQTFTLTYTAGANGTITGVSPQTVTYGHDGSTVTAVPDVGYKFDQWSDAVLTASRTDTNVTSDINVAASFSIQTFTLTYSAGANGSISGVSPQTVNYGEDGSAVTAVPNPGYSFLGWSDASMDNPRTDTGVTADINVTANFSEVASFTIDVSANPSEGGSASGGGTFEQGTDITVSAVANSGYEFVNWTEDDVEVSTDADYIFAVEGDRTLVANFSESEGPPPPPAGPYIYVGPAPFFVVHFDGMPNPDNPYDIWTHSYMLDDWNYTGHRAYQGILAEDIDLVWDGHTLHIDAGTKIDDNYLSIIWIDHYATSVGIYPGYWWISYHGYPITIDGVTYEHTLINDLW